MGIEDAIRAGQLPPGAKLLGDAPRRVELQPKVVRQTELPSANFNLAVSIGPDGEEMFQFLVDTVIGILPPQQAAVDRLTVQWDRAGLEGLRDAIDAALAQSVELRQQLIDDGAIQPPDEDEAATPDAPVIAAVEVEQVGAVEA